VLVPACELVSAKYFRNGATLGCGMKKERERTREVYVKKIYGFEFFARLFKWFNLSDCVLVK
jgi:hypothetical protein